MTTAAADTDGEFEVKSGVTALLVRVLIGFALLGALSGVILVAGKIYGHALVRAGHTVDTGRYEIVIGNDVLSVAGNMIRKADQRRGGIANRLELYLHWPTLTGYKSALTQEFNDVDPATNSIIFITIVPRATTRDMAGRFDPVYANVIKGVASDAGHGLKSHELDQKHGYINERLVYSTPDLRSGRRFVARCQDTDAISHIVLAPCESDIHLGETLSAQIRFPVHLLAQWQKLNATLPSLLVGMLTAEIQ